jgi:hypothetical protein
MKSKRSFFCGLALLLLALPLAARADLLSRANGQAYYDTVLNITWLADANYARTTGFASYGLMNWVEANAFASNATVLGLNDWRLPTLSSVTGGASFSLGFSNNGITDAGYAITGQGWATSTGAVTSELGYLFYVDLLRVGRCLGNNTDPSSCVSNPAWPQNNKGPFAAVPGFSFWTDVEASPTTAWSVNLASGQQAPTAKSATGMAWLVHPGDALLTAQGLDPVPVPAAGWLFGSALFGWAAVARRRQTNPSKLADSNASVAGSGTSLI